MNRVDGIFILGGKGLSALKKAEVGRIARPTGDIIVAIYVDSIFLSPFGRRPVRGGGGAEQQWQ